MHEYPFSMVDHYYFKDFISSLQPLFGACEKVKIHKQIDGNKGRIAITTDMWTASNQKKGYMAVTAHYVDNNWHLRNHMLRFMYVPAPHNANKLASILVHCMLSWNVDAKVSTITLDNCSTNDRLR
ncbi:Putative AC transposase [Linum perenne]